MNKAHKELLNENYEKACNAYVSAMLDLFDISRIDCFWVSDEVGGLFMAGDGLSLNMQEIIYIVENGLSYNECLEWQEYNVQAHEFNFNLLNLKSWHMGAPRVPQETFDRLRKMKRDLEDAIENEKNKF